MRSARLKLVGFLAYVAAVLRFDPIAATTLTFNSHLAVSLGSNGTSFITSVEELPKNLLITDKKTTKKKVNKSFGSNEMVQDDLVMCSQASNAVYDGQIDVLLLFSKCIGRSSLSAVESWAHDMKKIVDDTVDQHAGVSLNFKASMVSGVCTHTAYGAEEQEATDDDLDRLAAFPGLGDIYPLDSVTSSTDGLTAVISFATDETSYNEIVMFESVNQIVNVVNFQLSGSGGNCEGGPDSCIELKEDNDIFMYNPFTLTQSLDSELTMTNAARANDLVQQYFNYKDQAVNDGCSGNNRCDSQQFTKKNFFETKYTRYSHDEGISCFDLDAVLGDILNHQKITVNPLKHTNGTCYDEINPVPTDYDARYCEGDSDQTCAIEQCLVVNGDTFATVTAQIKPNAVAESEQVLQQLHQEDYQTVTQVHRALECTSYYGDDGQCEFMAKLSELFETTHALKFGGDFNANDYVHWRFKVNGDSEKWQLWKTRRQTSAETGCYSPTGEAV
ncbi:Hypothetical protein PHPALM_1897 [Phytophthora palmivora]|uniref:Uncharacterized protein n=1 Tax=Phytophthora palmivora TaxID=4796 RepID=A0A2P4YR34_9STRA|nr:Hypothetical protein PHPALM_1897 [Phytophthora palmivora]